VFTVGIHMSHQAVFYC